MKTIYFLFLCILLFSGCEKGAAEELIFLNLKVEGTPENVHWESVEGTLTEQQFKMTAAGYDLKKCEFIISLPASSDTIKVSDIKQFVFSDGLVFLPDSAKGVINLTRSATNTITGTFQVRLLNAVQNEEVTVSGDFGYKK